MAKTDHLQGLLAVEMLHPLLVVDVELLVGGGIIIIHIAGDVEINAPHRIHQGLECPDVHRHIVVDGDAYEIGDRLFQGLDPAGAIDGVDLRKAAVYQGISGDGDHAHLLLRCVVGRHHDGVGVSAPHVGGGQQKGIEALLAHQGHGCGGGRAFILRRVRIVGSRGTGRD